MATKEINAQITELKKKLTTLKSEKILGKLKDMSQLKKTRKQIAKLETKLSQERNGS
ncbi:MAG: 50S ribosomal protein L29 [Candidatus Dojkabacteria bacterium]|nr:MAG: 50S ribosomal protein L29 [Candidatus Dojkabacteria bacterium]